MDSATSDAMAMYRERQREGYLAYLEVQKAEQAAAEAVQPKKVDLGKEKFNVGSDSAPVMVAKGARCPRCGFRVKGPGHREGLMHTTKHRGEE